MNNQNDTSPQKSHPQDETKRQTLRLVAWEITRNCNLACVHCRASATRGPFSGELDTAAAFRLLDQIVQVGKPIIILTGGEPLLRTDIFDIAKYGIDRGLSMVMAPNGTLITKNIAEQIAHVGIRRISISLDGATPESHDRFRGVDGAFEGALRGIRLAKDAGIEFQINTTITKTNLLEIPRSRI
jgi:MoaA/NifB/PqqE/SkfB family radical SAM enzyme